MNSIADTPRPPYYAVIFTSVRAPGDEAAYQQTAEQMVELAARQPGFLGVESARSADGAGITVSYWDSLDDIRKAERRPGRPFGASRRLRADGVAWCVGGQRRLSEAAGQNDPHEEGHDGDQAYRDDREPA